MKTHLAFTESEQRNGEVLEIQLKLLDDTMPMPRYQHEGDAGLDLASRVALKLEPGERALVPTGIVVAIPPGWAGFVLPRSGLAARNGISLVNSPGLIDSGYRGEVSVVIINTDKNNSFEIQKGDRIAQLVIQRVQTVRVRRVEELDETPRAQGGFGSTGV